MDELLQCSFCQFQSSSHHLLLKHTRVHEHEPNFIVYCSICGKSERKWGSLRKHLQRFHKDIADNDTSDQQQLIEPSDYFYSDSVISNNDETFSKDSYHDFALFLLKASNSLSLTHSGVDQLCESTQSFIEVISDKIKHNVFQALERNSVSLTPSLREEITSACNVNGSFSCLSNCTTREAFY